jgi:hypothetical protein
MVSLCECGALPNPEMVEKEKVPFLYCLAWFATDQRNPADWMRATFRHEHYVTLEEAPALHPGNVAPDVRIETPVAGAAVAGNAVRLEGRASDRNGGPVAVELYRAGGAWLRWNERPVSALRERLTAQSRLGEAAVGADGRWFFVWDGAPAGCHDVVAVARDGSGATGLSNVVRLAAGYEDLALGRPVVATSAQGAAAYLVDGDAFTIWWGARREPQRVTIDLEAERTVAGVGVMWWKAIARSWRIEVSRDGKAWETVHEVANWRHHLGDGDVSWLKARRARYVRLTLTARGTSWGGFSVGEVVVLGGGAAE